MEKLTKRHIDEAINHVFNQPEPERRIIKALRGCIHSGQLVETMNTCGDPECPGCEMVSKAFRDVVMKQMEELLQKEFTEHMSK